MTTPGTPSPREHTPASEPTVAPADRRPGAAEPAALRPGRGAGASPAAAAGGSAGPAEARGADEADRSARANAPAGPEGAAGAGAEPAGAGSGPARAAGADSAGPGAGGAQTDPARLAEAIRAMGRAGRRADAPGDSATGDAAEPAAEGADPNAATDAARTEALRAASETLSAGGAPAALAPAAVAALGERAAELLREDPWAVLGLPGVRPEQADGFARGLLCGPCEPGDARRVQALAVHLLERAALRGDTAVELGTIRSALEQAGVPEVDEALAALLGEGRVMAFQEEEPMAGRRGAADEDEEPPVRVLLALDRWALAEESLADGLVRLVSTFEPAPPPAALTPGVRPEPAASDEPDGQADASGREADGRGRRAGEPGGGATDGQADGPGGERTAAASPPGPRSWAEAAKAAPSRSAADLVRACAEHGLVLHTGGEAARAEPAAVVQAARALGLRAWLAVATEDGRRRLGTPPPGPEGSGAAPVATLAGLLSGAEGPGRAEDGTLALDLLAVCDAPRLDVESAATLVESLPDGARLLLSGDPAELWSAGPGRVFADLLAAKVCPVVASRTPDEGPIGELLSGIGIGELLPVEAPGKEVVVVNASSAEETVHRVVQLVHDSIPRALGIPADAVRVITPGHGGQAGTRVLNGALKARANPGPGRFAGFDPGDQVVHSPAPGDVRPATVLAAVPDGLRLRGETGEEFTVPRAQVEAGQLRHGWALTAHQAVGRRWPAAVAVLPGDAAAGLTRQLVYTAFSRGERHLSVVQAAGQALPQAVATVPAQPRTTRLRGILAEQAPQD